VPVVGSVVLAQAVPRRPVSGVEMVRTRLLRPSVVIPVVVIVVGAAVWTGLRAGRGAAATTAATATSQLFTVSPTTLAQTASASGTIAPAETENLSFEVAGTVTAVKVAAGQTVKQGQVLATLGSAALESAVAQAQATLASAGAQLSDDQTAGASSAQITADQTNVSSAYANVVAAVQSLSGATLTSPIAGTVATVDLTVGEVLGSSGASGTSITGTGTGSGRSAASASNASSASATGTSSTSSSSSQIEVISTAYVVNLSVGTTTIGNVKVGQSATVTPMSSSGSSGGGGGGGGRGGFGGGGGFGAGPQSSTSGSSASTSTATGASTTGTVTSVGAIASSSSGVATFPVAIAVNGTPAGFHAGASASVAITYHRLTNVLAVPANAVTQSSGTSSVTVSTNGKTAIRTVTTGLSSGGQIQITSGLQSGDQIVVNIPTFRRTSASGTSSGSSTSSGGGGFSGGAGSRSVTP
jgi:membrane fusion protein, macrolide-specific efflux system